MNRGYTGPGGENSGEPPVKGPDQVA